MNHRILIVEDETKTSEYLAKALKTKGFDVDCAIDGNSGILKLKKNHYDLIILDLKMPGKNGDEVLEEIREIDPLIMVVIYTNYEQAPVMKNLINLGIDGYIRKGANADLWGTVEFIKSKFYPLEPEKEKELMRKIINKIEDSNEVYA
jgi:DNA-binding response OmpR family regulator